MSVGVACAKEETDRENQTIADAKWIDLILALMIESFPALDNSIKVKKYRFIKVYYQARGKLTPKVIKQAFRTAGIWPFNPDKVLTSSYVRDAPVLSIQRPVTPLLGSQKRVFKPVATPPTLRVASDFSVFLNKIPRPSHVKFIAKAQKTFERQLLECVQKDHKITQLEAQLRHHSISNKRKKVAVAPGEIFVNIEQVHAAKEAQEEVARKEAKRAKSYVKNHSVKELEKASEDAEAQGQSGMEFVWELV
ncbi:hypothetical protein EG328_008709 [Venturia inaequalis]|uniref:Uncharacterized protein n=1 Tax=Venturia inaequalis TaxID=5025 RepID=A0A8H3ZCW7_VENIN|nr:hypothetical protein EG328_008709 [Venturia inaequalis]